MKGNSEDPIVEIDSDLYEKLALMGMELGEDNVNDFINDVIYYQLKKLQQAQSKGEGE